MEGGGGRGGEEVGVGSREGVMGVDLVYDRYSSLTNPIVRLLCAAWLRASTPPPTATLKSAGISGPPLTRGQHRWESATRQPIRLAETSRQTGLHLDNAAAPESFNG